MLSSMFHRCGAAVAVVLAAIFIGQVWAQEAEKEAEGLIPCLAIAADGSPICPLTSFPPSKQVTAAFRLKPDAAAKTLASRWVAVDDGGKVIAENTLDLQGQKSGWLRLTLEQPAPAGKYRLETTLDGAPWKAADLQVVASPTAAADLTPADLYPLVEGTSVTFDIVVHAAPGGKSTIPGVTPDADGVSRATGTMSVGETKDDATRIVSHVNGREQADFWVKKGEHGWMTVKRKDGDAYAEVTPPEIFHPLPPSLEHESKWTIKLPEKEEMNYQLFGPIPVQGPDGPDTGFVAVGSSKMTLSKPGTEAVQGTDSVERHYIPKLGLMREARVQMVAGKLAMKISATRATRYRIIADSKMKGRLGRVQFASPEGTSGNAHVKLFKAGAKEDSEPTASGYGDKSFDVMPGKYEASINNKRVPIEVRSAHATTPMCGVLRVHASSSTHFRVLDADQKTELFSAYGEKDVVLPVGSYFIEISGATEAIKIEDGKALEF